MKKGVATYDRGGGSPRFAPATEGVLSTEDNFFLIDGFISFEKSKIKSCAILYIFKRIS